MQAVQLPMRDRSLGLPVPFALAALLAVGWALVGWRQVGSVAALPRDLQVSGPAVQAILLAAATLVSEDLTCLTAGQLLATGHVRAGIAVGGCAAGIWLGDVLLYLVGRWVGPQVLRSRWVRPWYDSAQSRRLRRAMHARPGAILMASRLLPGTRLPLYLACGAIRVPPGRFALWTFIAVALWTPAVVLAAAAIGRSLAEMPWWRAVLAVLATLMVFKAVRLSLTEQGRGRLMASVSRLWRWEFWPAWLFYLPVVPLIAWWSLRYRGFTTITAANPGIPHGGFVGESKAEILSRLDPERVLPFARIDEPDPASRQARFDRVLEGRHWDLPIILKPDVGQRGAGVRLVRTREQAHAYLARTDRPMLVQVYHPGPHEAGVFYMRTPGAARGRIFSITDKRFPTVTGDGRSTLEQLVWRHPRLRLQARTFLRRHRRQRYDVLGRGQVRGLAVCGNHCQGTMFCDGRHLWSEALEREVDRVARSFDGFYFGRFDVRYADADAFRRGEDLWIVELNGVTSESGDMYDPRGSLLGAYRILARQWMELFRIGSANSKAGHKPSSTGALLRAIVHHAGCGRRESLAD